MKLIFCPDCYDMRKLSTELTECACGRSHGQYDDDGICATIGGRAVAFGIHNNDVREALNMPQDEPATVRCWRFVSTSKRVRRGLAPSRGRK